MFKVCIAASACCSRAGISLRGICSAMLSVISRGCEVVKAQTPEPGHAIAATAVGLLHQETMRDSAYTSCLHCIILCRQRQGETRQMIAESQLLAAFAGVESNATQINRKIDRARSFRKSRRFRHMSATTHLLKTLKACHTSNTATKPQ